MADIYNLGLTGDQVKDILTKSLPAAEGGSALSLVSTGEKYIWNNKQDTLSITETHDHTFVITGKLEGALNNNNIYYNPSIKISHDTLVAPAVKADALHIGDFGDITLLQDDVLDIDGGVGISFSASQHSAMKLSYTDNYTSFCLAPYDSNIQLSLGDTTRLFDEIHGATIYEGSSSLVNKYATFERHENKAGNTLKIWTGTNNNLPSSKNADTLYIVIESV